MECDWTLELLKEEHIKGALAAEKGCDVQLVSWCLNDFVNEKDNYASVVKFITVNFSDGEKLQITSYVVKLSPSKQTDLDTDKANYEFTRESGFYSEIVPQLNFILAKGQLESLRVPKCLFAVLEKGKELMILEDLQKQEFRKYDRKKSLDVAHTNLVLQELARLHASSLLLQYKTPNTDLLEKYSYILDVKMEFRPDDEQFFTVYIENAQRVLQEIEGYEKVEQWMRNNKSSILSLMYEQFKGAPPFNVVIHGDCWSSNFLFRYDNTNQPTEVMLLDFQDIYKSSLAADLNDLMFMCLDGDTRSNHLNTFLATYHATFTSVMEKSGSDMPFSLGDLHEEYKKKHMIGLVSALVAVPWLVSEEEGLHWYNGPPEDEECMEVFLENLKSRTMKMLNADPVLRRRYLSVFDDMIDAKVIK